MQITNSRWGSLVGLASVLSLLLPACAPSASFEDEEAVEEDGERDPQGPKTQGSLLHGAPIGNFRIQYAGATRAGAPVSVALSSGHLEVRDGAGAVVSAEGLQLVGFQGASAVSFRIRASGGQPALRPHVNPYPASPCSTPADDTEYLVEYRAGGSWKKLCAGGYAIAVNGFWNATGDFYDVAHTVFVFACVDRGVIAKCFDWCYKPHVPSLVQHHYACTRMARADYCGQGKANTIYDTFIDSWDTLGVVGTDCMAAAPAAKPVECNDPGTACTDHGKYLPMDFEAAWRPGHSGADGQSKQSAAICLSKKRWQTLPLNGHCPMELPDPRTDDRAKYCDDLTLGELAMMGGLHYNFSSYYDIGLWGWQSGADHYTTTVTDGKVAPAGGYTSPFFEGALYRQEPTDGVPIRTWRSGADYILTTNDAEAMAKGWTFVRDEGFVVSSAVAKPVPSARKLFCYVKKTGGDYWTTTKAMPGTYKRCFGAGTFEGWLPY